MAKNFGMSPRQAKGARPLAARARRAICKTKEVKDEENRNKQNSQEKPQLYCGLGFFYKWIENYEHMCYNQYKE
jgi:hypothetical protein